MYRLSFVLLGADEILDNISAYCQRINDSGH
jgi:hypothetical protein